MDILNHKDRTYYRQQTKAELLDEAKRGLNVDWQELCIALAERVEGEEYEARAWECPHCGY